MKELSRGIRLEKEFEYKGLNCVVLIMPMGHRCGYVEAPEEYRGVDYDTDDISMLRVHGGVTFSGRLVTNDGKYYFGFDTAHAGDKADPELISSKYKRFNTDFDYGTIRDLDYVVENIKELADQLLKL
jgi:hypothetical protein